jgi:murein DD-endopeptidase MepM/ murein hydrolase activator NlpD
MRQPLIVAIALIVGSCTRLPLSPDAAEVCDGFADWRTSAYVLPYTVASSAFVSGGNCEVRSGGHKGVKKFGYDFDMPIGTPVRAARAGAVLHTEQSHREGEISETGNYIVALQEDGTSVLYGHLTYQGVAVAVADRILPGMLLGYSGNTGNTGTSPHLHFSVQSCDPVTLGTSACPTIAVTFRNTDPNPMGLQVGHTYPANPY